MGLLAWGRTLDDKVVGLPQRRQRAPNPWFIIGLPMFVIFSGGLLRLIFQERTATPEYGLWIYLTGAVLGLALVLAGAAQRGKWRRGDRQ